MEEFGSIPPIAHGQQEGVSEMFGLEKKRELAQRIKNLHDHFEERIRRVYKEKTFFQNKYKDVVATKDRWWELTPADMSSADARVYSGLMQEEAEFAHTTSEVIKEALYLLSDDKYAHWQRQPRVGVPGSLSDTNSRHYQSKLDDIYAFEVSWYDYPEDDGRVPESFRESYSAKIVGSREVVVRKGVAGFARKTETQQFPLSTLGVTQNDERQFRPSLELAAEFDEAGQAQFQERLLALGKKLREQWG